MTSWTKGHPTSPVAVGVDDPSAATPFCDTLWCVPFFSKFLHSIECEMANGMDPVFPDRKIVDVLPDRSLMREAVEGTPYGDDAA
jgi:hypothetical protein